LETDDERPPSLNEPATESDILQVTRTNDVSYGTIPAPQRRPRIRASILRGVSDGNFPGARFFSASTPPSPVQGSPSYFRNGSERPIPAYDAALGLQSPASNEDTAADAKINGIRVWYSSFSSIDWLHDAIKDSVRFSRLRSRKSLRARIRLIVDKSLGWWIVTIVGFLAAVVAFLIVRSEQWLFDSKEGYCRDRWWKAQRYCCPDRTEGRPSQPGIVATHVIEACAAWRTWVQVFGPSMQNGRWIGFEQEIIEYIAHTLVAVRLFIPNLPF
jgi:chloride channel 3/4/5